jgi:hypothetical protein
MSENPPFVLDEVRKYFSWSPTSQEFNVKFGDWTSVSDLLKRMSDQYPPGSWKAAKLKELAKCEDSSRESKLNSGTPKEIIRKVFIIVREEICPELILEEDSKHRRKSKKVKTNPSVPPCT